ncbi:hypothetical protein [Endozoicomonas sp. ALD040]|uniref:hypothetical protein n=1 Tax=Endozoicomonas sp. ALD040 TaxID=3403079 RepID=UPI003BB1B6CA
MKRPLFAALLLLSIACQASIRHFVVELEQDAGSPDKSFSIKQHDPHTLTNTPSIIASNNGHSDQDSPANDTPFGPGIFGLITIIIESVSWHLLYASQWLVAYELILTSHDTQSSKTYSRLPLESFITVGLFLSNYWNSDSPMFNPIGQQESSQDYPFMINTMTLSSGDNQQQGQLSESSTRQASGTTSGFRGTITSRQYSDSDGGDEVPEQHQHTLGLNCFADNCNGVCKFRQSGARPKQSSTPNEDFDRQSPLVQQHTCKVTVFGEGGRQRACGQICQSNTALKDHKRRKHRQHTCYVTVAICNGRRWPCGLGFRTARGLMWHKRIHQRRRPDNPNNNNGATIKHGG